MVKYENHSPCQRIAAYVSKHHKRLQSNLGQALETGDMEAIHDLRVASRRLSEPLKLMATHVCHRRARRADRHLKDIRGAFREVRDLDAAQACLIASAPDRPLNAEDLARLEGLLTHEREKAFETARRACKKMGAVDSIEQIRTITQRFCDCVDSKLEQEIRQAVDVLVDSWIRRLLDTSPVNGSTTDLHDTRLCVKRLRYAVELRRDLDLRDDAPLLGALAQLQELLGQWNDQLVTASHVVSMAQRTELLTLHSPWSARLLEHAAGRIRAAELIRPQIIQYWGIVEDLLRSRPTTDSTPPANTDAFMADPA